MDEATKIESTEKPPEMAAKPDIMNDPAFDTDPLSKGKGVEDSDTCRICRGEGSKDEPLFYPCKCSGSIKFVHQNCLMEWLSHSQKKHCELCKTPFRFTKLYSPHMPNSVPPLVFMRQAFVHAYKSILSWWRLQLVLFVWGACLPYCMRSIWRGLFWFADGGWVTWQEVERRATAAAQQHMDRLAATGTTPANLNHFMSRDAAASAVVTHFNNALPSILQPISSTSNFFSGGPLLFRLGKKLVHSMVSRFSNQTVPAAVHPVATNLTIGPKLEAHSSLLSNVGFLKAITRFPKINGMLIDMFEGQIITLSIVVAFILIFLIREWVVQQQPAMALAANAAAPDVQAENVLGEEIPTDRQPDQEAEQEPLQAQPAATPTEGDDRHSMPATGTGVLGIPPTARPTLQERLQWLDAQGFPRELLDLPTSPVEGDQVAGANDIAGDQREPKRYSESDEVGSSESPRVDSRPSMPTREAFDRAAEIRRTLEENSVGVGQRDRQSSMKIFTDIWIRAGDRPSEVLQIIDREGRNEELSWIVAAMKRLENRPAPVDLENATRVDDQQPGTDENIHLANRNTENRPELSNRSSPKLVPNRYGDAGLQSSTLAGTMTNTEPAVGDYHNISAGLPQSDRDFKGDPGDISFGLRDISNQQLDGPVDDPISQKDDSDGSFEFLSRESEPNPSSSAHAESNPFGPEHESSAPPSPSPASSKSINPPTGETMMDPVEQEQNLRRIIDERDNLMREGHDFPGSNEQDGQLGSVVQPNNEGLNPPRGYLDCITDWLWGAPPTIATRPEIQDGDDEHIVDQVEEEAPFVPMAQGRPVFEPDEQPVQNPAPGVQDPEVAAVAAEAGLDLNDAGGVEEAEDLEGIMELVGLQGPLFGLIQNAIFCTVIVAITIALGIWVPYISGKLFLIFLTNPVSLLFKMPLRWASTTADMLVDICVFSAGCAFYWVDMAISFVCRPAIRLIPPIAMITQQSALAGAAKDYAESALDRLARNLIATSGSFFESDVPSFSVVAHESLLAIKQGVSTSIKASYETAVGLVNVSSAYELTEHFTFAAHDLSNTTAGFASTLANGITDVKFMAQSASLSKVLQVNLTIPQRTTPLDFTLAYWDSKDRALAILLGYIFFALIGVTYLNISASLRGQNASGRVEGSVADILYQAGGVLKVILIISIEMIVFPLFCGLLLDVALLPLFGDVDILSRLNFGLEAPWTSLFIHWFIGTCYMFHFALFVSMCRKLMRTGVLYFIRDPDDPTFHPVRDVLERNLFTQLRKIVFSAVVYGGLVMICLGGVVWGISYTFEAVFPVHWSSNEPVLEFPVDLLFYNFLMPVAVKFFKPSNALNKVYGWWFRKCARALRLSHFLFGEKKEDEEGRHVRRTWQDVFDGKLGDPSKPVTNIEQQMIHEDRGAPAYFLRDGRYVRAPASDQVRMPKGTHTFLEVDEHNNRVDKLEDQEQGPHGNKNEQFTKVYIPPYFRLRISIFIFLIWLFAATTGVCTTVLPLVLGRRIFSRVAPSHLRINDIYAFSIGIYVLGGTVYALLYASRGIAFIRASLFPSSASPTIRSLFHPIQSHFYRFLRILYTYASFTVLLPVLFALLMQTYFIIPLHTFFGSANDRHTIHVVQDWTLGVLYIQALGRFILWNSPSRPADALRGVVRKGWLDPDARLATRAFIFPATVLMAFLLALPLTLGRVANILYATGEDEVATTLIYRYSPPALLGLGLATVGLWAVKGALQAWRGRIRDEVYLIGERLHNFGESRQVRKAAVGGRVDVRA